MSGSTTSGRKRSTLSVCGRIRGSSRCTTTFKRLQTSGFRLLASNGLEPAVRSQFCPLLSALCPENILNVPTPSDLFLSPDLTEEQAREYLGSLGFRDAAAADTHLQAMADDMSVREALGRVAPELLPALLESPDPDAAVVGLSR